MDDHFYSSGPSSQRWSDLRHVDNVAMKGALNYRELEDHFHDVPLTISQHNHELAFSHGDDPTEGPSIYRELENHRTDAETRPGGQDDSITQPQINHDAIAALEGNRVSWQPGPPHDKNNPTARSPAHDHERGRRMSRKERFSHHFSHFSFRDPSTWLPTLERDHSPSPDHTPTTTLRSNDPNDPQNWPPLQKKLTYATICLFSFLANINASAFTVATLPLMRTFHISATQATALTALNVLMFGLGNLIWVPVMRILGKRPVYLLAISVLIVTNTWSFAAKGYGSLLASRMIGGIGAAAADATVPSVVEDLWEGKRKATNLMFFSAALASGIFLGPLINAWVVERHGWRWTPGWLAAAFGVVFVLAFLFVRETTYRTARGQWSDEEVPMKRGVGEWWGLGLGREREKSAGAVVVQTLRDIVGMTAYVQVLWASCLIGVIVGWTIIIQITAGQVFTRPATQGGAYHWRLGLVGVFHIAGWIGAILAGRLGGVFADRLAGKAQMKQGLAERPPQYRMQALAFWAPICPVGLIIYGVCVAKTTLWVGPAFGYAIHSFGFAAIANIGITYVVDCFGDLASEALVSLFIIRNIIGVICSFYCNPWIARDGMPAAFGTMAALEWVMLAVAVSMFFFHERLLNWTRTYGPAMRLPPLTQQCGEHIELQTHQTGAESV